MGDVGIVFSVGRWVATRHDTDCSYYQRAVHRCPPLALPATVPIYTCATCEGQPSVPLPTDRSRAFPDITLTDEIGITVNDYGRRATFHLTNCGIYRLSTHITRSVPVDYTCRVCSFCQPSREQMLAVAAEIEWQYPNTDAFNYRVGFGDVETAERIMEQQRAGKPR